MNDREFKRWQKLRKKGLRHFTLINGLLLWGLPMFVVMTFIVNDPFDGSGLILSYVLISALIWTLGGLLFGYLIWFATESRYKKALLKRKNSHIRSIAR